MNGPEHYREAERLLELAKNPSEVDGWQQRQAQVHATLALAAATAMGLRGQSGPAARHSGMHSADFAAWDEVAGVSL